MCKVLLSTYESYSGRRHGAKVGTLRRAEWYWLSRELPGVRRRRGRHGITRPTADARVALNGSETKAANGSEGAMLAEAIMVYWRIWSGDRGAA